MFNRRMHQEHPRDESRGMRSPGLWLGAMVAVVAMGFVALVNLGGAASGAPAVKPSGSLSDSMDPSGSMSASQSESAGKVMICHALGNGGGYNLMEIELEALDSHLAHGDIYPNNGECMESSQSATATETSTSTPTSTPTATPTVTVTAVVPGPGSVSVVTSTQTATATATVTATPTITPAPAVVEQSPTITPAPGVVAEQPTVAPLPATVPAGGGGEAPGGLPIWALLAMTAAVIAGIGASVRLSQRTSR